MLADRGGGFMIIDFGFRSELNAFLAVHHNKIVIFCTDTDHNLSNVSRRIHKGSQPCSASWVPSFEGAELSSYPPSSYHDRHGKIEWTTAQSVIHGLARLGYGNTIQK